MLTVKKAYRTVCKRYPRIAENYRLRVRWRRAADNKLLKSRAARRLIGRLTEVLSPFFGRGEKIDDLTALFWRLFEEEAPSDEIIFLCEDLAAAASLLLLADCPPDRSETFEAAATAFLQPLEKLKTKRLYERFSTVDRVLTKRDFHAYPRCDEESRIYLRSLVYAYAKRRRIPDAEAARLIREDCIRKRFENRKRFFLWLMPTLTILFILVTLYFCGIVETLFLLLPMLAFSFEAVSAIASVAISPSPILKLDVPKVGHRTVAVITALLLSAEDAADYEKKLERMYLQNKEENVVFGLLCDYKDADEAVLPGDGAIRDAVTAAITRLNEKYPDRFCLFIRPRSYAPGEKRYMGKERKRGALTDLCRYLKNKKSAFGTVILPRGYRGQTKYLLTLDADTELRRDAVKKMYAALIHPSNRPVLKGRVVVSGYGVIQPRMAASVESAGRTRFSALFSGGAGSDSYENAVFDLYQSVFGKGAFCGKGMFDLDVFDRVIVDRFPEGRILSHDLLEGTRLRCGYMSELTLTDSSPSNALSYYKRKHRWIRGDFQSFPFALRRLPFEKEKIRNPIGGVSKLMILSNVLRALTPVSSMICLLFSGLLEEERCAVFLFFTFGYLLFPLLLTVARTAKFVCRRFYSTVLQNVWQGVFRTLYALCALSYEASLSFDALCRVLYRSFFSGRKLLEWVTAGEGEKAGGRRAPSFPAYLKAALPSLPAAFVLLFFGGGVRLTAVLFLLFPLISYLLSLPFVEERPISQKDAQTLKNYARDSFSFFERFVTERDSFLPPDNFQERPAPVLAHRTSPTNIALYLLSVISMYDLGYLDAGAALDRLGQTLSTVVSLPKYRGHLYNWYDTVTRDVLGQPFVSTVDSGNFVLSLCALRGFLSELDDPRAKELHTSVCELLSKTDFSFLYDRDACLLSVGYDPVEEKRSEGCYDLLASEARSAYFYAIAKGQIPAKSWGKLGRAVTVRDGHLGILSWSGTAFEYFMPALFLPVYKNTLLYEALCFAVYEQMHDRAGRLWGRSESGYFAFDREMNYQYKAFGCASLAIDPDAARQNVIAPYASFLALCMTSEAPIANLARLKEAGAKGAYGFYEAIDFTRARVGRGRALICSYMAHHIGMSIAAVNNRVNGGILVRRVLADKELEAACELLKESVPCDTPASALSKAKNRAGARLRFSLPGVQGGERHSPENALLFRKNTRILSIPDGRVFLSYGDCALTPPPAPGCQPVCRPFLALRLKDGVCDLLGGRVRRYCDGRELVFARTDRRLSAHTHWLIDENGGILIHVETSAREENAFLLFSAPLALCTAEEYRSHPAFCGLCIEASFLAEERMLVFRRREIDGDRPGLFVGFAFADGGEFSFVSSFDDLPQVPLPRMADRLFTDAFFSRTGALRKPFCAIGRRPDGNGKADLLILFGQDEKDLRAQLSSAREKEKKTGYYRYLVKDSRLYRKAAPEVCPQGKDGDEYLSLLLSGVLHYRRREMLPAYRVEELWKFAVSGDRPIITVCLPGKALLPSAERVIEGLIAAHARLRRAGILCDLIFLSKEDDRYFSPQKKAFEELLVNTVGLGENYQNRGLFFLTDRRANEILPSFSRVFVPLEEDCVFPIFKKRFLSCLDLEKPAPAAELDEPVSAASGRVTFKDGALRVSRRLRRPPYSYIYCGKQFGTMLTDGSLGFTFFRNAGEFRLTPFSGDEIEGFFGERLLLVLDGGRFDLCAGAAETAFTEGCAEYTGAFGRLSYKLTVGCALKYPVKLLVLRLKNEGGTPLSGEVRFEVSPCLGRLPDGNIAEKRVGETVFYKRTALYNGLPFAMYVSPEKVCFELSEGEETDRIFLLGVYDPGFDRCFYAVKEAFSAPAQIYAEFENYAAFYKRILSKFALSSGAPSIDAGLNRHFPYQALTARLWGRTGFYQPGGAYGFRDQLQDAMCMAYYLPEELKYQIYRCASHQYAEGDVQHWWHPLDHIDGMGDRGVRTRCSDDYLFLPLAVARYLSLTGDRALLEKKICYLSSPPLGQERDRYERPEKTQRRESVYFHCLRAVDRAAANRSARGLLLMGSGDWNDGMSDVRGESVFLTQFFALTLKSFLPFAQEEDKERFRTLISESAEAVESCFEGGRYLRAFFPSGTPLGAPGCPYCKIDLLPQAFAVFAGCREAKTAIGTAYDLLWDRDAALFRLFAPPYEDIGRSPGYLGGYCPGFRENGGQYTHAAVWGAMALLRAGENEKGYEALRSIDPGGRDREVYRLEPYALAGDVYTANGYTGRGGWSQYTGAAGWYIYALLHDLLGYEEREDGFCLCPRLCASFPAFTLEVRKRATVYRLEVSSGAAYSLLTDGKRGENRFFFDGGEHIVKIILQNPKE